MNLDTLIQQKREEFEKVNKDMQWVYPEEEESVFSFLESTIREVAGMVCEEIVPEKPNREPETKDGMFWRLGFNDCRSQMLDNAKSKGFITN